MWEGEKVWVGSAGVEGEGEVTGGEGEERGDGGASVNWELVAWSNLTFKKKIQKGKKIKRGRGGRAWISQPEISCLVKSESFF